MRELFRKYLDNNCSPDEVRRLLAHFNVGENETLLRKLITEWLEENDEKEMGSRWQDNFYCDLRLIKRQLNIETIRRITFFRKIGFHVTAATRICIFL
ncbi:MAG TPA: hypothetical protein VK589_23345 [Chryseolinea sp.]|nr:hypothetical protein [Chryseolinea sp.]